MNLYRNKRTGALVVMLALEDSKAGPRAHYERVGGASGLMKESEISLPASRFFDGHDQLTEVDVNQWRAAWLKTT